jgi:hypothetical protein
VAGNGLIAAYSRDVGARLGPDVAMEILDHLTEAFERLVAGGDSPDEAARRAIASLGGSEDLAAGFMAAGVGIPTGFTRLSGRALSAAAILLTTSLVMLTAAHVVEAVQGWGPLAELIGGLGAVINAAGLASLTFGAVGIVRRSRGVSPTTVIAVALIAAATVGGLATWFVFGWGTALALGLGTVAIRAAMSHLPPTRAVTFMVAGTLTIGTVPWLALAWMPGQAVVDSLVVRTAMAFGLVLVTLGVWGMGRWLLRDGSATKRGRRTPRLIGSA